MNKSEKIINDILVNKLISFYSKRKTAPSELINVFVVRSMQAIQKADSAEISEHFSELSELVFALVRDCKHSLSPNDIFAMQVGEIYACVSMITEMLTLKKKEEALARDRVYFINNIRLFELIRDDNSDLGIQHFELAKKLNKSASALSQLICKFTYFDYISYNKVGREKYYKLTPKGSTMLKYLVKEANKEAFEKNTEENDSAAVDYIITQEKTSTQSDRHIKTNPFEKTINGLSSWFYENESFPISSKQKRVSTGKDGVTYILYDAYGTRLPIQSTRETIDRFVKCYGSLWVKGAKFSSFITTTPQSTKVKHKMSYDIFTQDEMIEKIIELKFDLSICENHYYSENRTQEQEEKECLIIQQN